MRLLLEETLAKEHKPSYVLRTPVLYKSDVIVAFKFCWFEVHKCIEDFVRSK